MMCRHTAKAYTCPLLIRHLLTACNGTSNAKLDARTPSGMCRQGEVLAWGINDFGQLGNGSTFYETSPTQVMPSVCLCACGERADHGSLFVGE